MIFKTKYDLSLNEVSLMFDDFDTLSLKFGQDSDQDFEGEDEEGGHVRRKVKNYGKGNVDIIEEKTLNKDGRQVKKVSVRKIRRNYG